MCEKIRKTHLCPGIEFVRLNIRLLIRIKTFDKTIISRYVFLTLYDNIYQSQVRDVSRNRIRNWAKKLHPKGKKQESYNDNYWKASRMNRKFNKLF